MPLGRLIACKPENVLQRVTYIIAQPGTSGWDENEKHFAEELEAGHAVNTAKGHMALEGIILEDEQLQNLLMGQETLEVIDGGEMVVCVNKADLVKDLSRKLSNTTRDDIAGLHNRVEREMYQRRLAAVPPPKPQGFFARLMGKSSPVRALPPEPKPIHDSLLNLFDEIKSFYGRAADNNFAVITMVMT